MLLVTYIHTSPFYCIIEQHISNDENKADKKQIQRGQVKLVQLVYDLSLVPKCSAHTLSCCNCIGVAVDAVVAGSHPGREIIFGD